MNTDHQEQTDEHLLARGGGNATASGVSFQASVGALFACRLLAERNVDDRLRLDDARIRSIRFETEAPLDDLLIETDASGWIFVQAKTTLSLSEGFESEFGKTVAQIARQWKVCGEGNGKRKWDRPLNARRDRMVIVVGPEASGRIARDLTDALASLHAHSHAPLPQAQRQALDTLSASLAASWQKLSGTTLSADDIGAVLQCVSILQFDPSGADGNAAVEVLRHVTEDAADAPAAFDAVKVECESLMVKRHGTDSAELRLALARIGLRLRAAPSYREDVDHLRAYSGRVQLHLEEYEKTDVNGLHVKIERGCTAAVVEAANGGSLVIVGEPGAGKSAVISAAAERLRSEGNEVVELAVDRLLVNSLEGLNGELGITHPLRDVLANWPGAKVAFLLIDALDATRGGKAEAIFRTLISDVLKLAGDRWHVVASIRTFDLRLGEQFRQLFRGRPPAGNEFTDNAFPAVRHIHVPRWTNDELAEFLDRAPVIKTAIERGGARMRELALVPFNTRLLADLISGGLSADAFGDIRSQVQLLELYWQHRVDKHGTAAELCLKKAVREMVLCQNLQADRLSAAEADSVAFDRLLAENVLDLLPGGRKIKFRHHILFDYAASRVFIDPSDITATAQLLQRESGLGLMLAPALSFALQALWAEEQGKPAKFWQAVAHFAGDAGSDPVARSVAARAASELPVVPEEINGLAALLLTTGPDQDIAFVAFSHIVGALAVRFDDRQPVRLTSWCHLAAEASANAAQIVWSLRTLVFLLVDRIDTPEQRTLLGHAARAVLQVALEQELPSQLTAGAIGFVADTYASDPSASRRLLQRLLEPERLRLHAHEDMSWLARKVGPIGSADPDFVVDIYRTIFGHAITNEAATSISNSQILPLRSNSRQDYEMARYALKEAFPAFLRAHPAEGISALVTALDGYITNSQRLGDKLREEIVGVADFEVKLVEDLSHIWAWNPNDAHSDNAASLVQSFRSRLLEASSADAEQIVSEAIRRNGFAVVWSRLFMAGGARPRDVGVWLWPIAAKQQFLTSPDTGKDAIDLVAARYPHEPPSVLREFEEQVLRFDFPRSTDAEKARERFLTTLFQTVGSERLVTDEARRFIRALPQGTQPSPNRRPYEIFTTSGPADRFWWFKDKGVDIDAEPVASILNQTEDLQTQLGLFGKGSKSFDIAHGLDALRALARSAEEAEQREVPPLVIEHVEETIAQGCERLSQETEALRADRATLQGLCDFVEPLLASASPRVNDETEAKHEASLASSGGTRLDAGQAAINLCRVDEMTFGRFMPALLKLIRDPHPEVRLAIAHSLGMLWETAREAMWQLAAAIAEEEQNRRVLSFFADFLMRVVHADPAHVETLILRIQSRIQPSDNRPDRELREALGGLVLLLWVSHERPAAEATLRRWLDAPASYETELSRAVHAIREGLILGYGEESETDAAIRRRCQEFAARLIEVTASGLERYYALPAHDQTDEEGRRARSCAILLDTAGDQFYFSSGAFREGQSNGEKGLARDDLKRAFLVDNGITFRRIGDSGTPHTIFHLIELLGFLTSADPEHVFDLVAHALLTAGRKQGYQFESLGADRFVDLIGRFLADHRDIFEDSGRRNQLVACLDAFVEAGWPAARRLLYRLPELVK